MYQVKFIRVEDELFVSDPGQSILHDVLAKQDGITDRIAQLCEVDESLLDAGSILVNDFRKKTISVSGRSVNLGLPDLRDRVAANKARQQTVVIFQAQTPDYEVSGSID